MRLGLNYIAPLLAAGAAAMTIAVAPIATAAPTAPGHSSQVQPSCVVLGGTQSECQAPGNVQINDAPPQVDYSPVRRGRDLKIFTANAYQPHRCKRRGEIAARPESRARCQRR